MKYPKLFATFTIAFAVCGVSACQTADPPAHPKEFGSKSGKAINQRRAAAKRRAGSAPRSRPFKRLAAKPVAAPGSPRRVAPISGKGALNIAVNPGIPSKVQAALRVARERQDVARLLIAIGRERDAIDVLNAARREIDAGPAAGLDIVFDPLAVDAYIFLHRDRDALALLQGGSSGEPSSVIGWNGRIPRQGLLLARNGSLKESLDLDPATPLLRSGSGSAEETTRALPDLTTQRGLVAAWCLAVAEDETGNNNKNIADRYYRMALDADPGQPFLALSYGLFLYGHGNPAQAVPLLQYAAPRVTGMLRLSAETCLREIAELRAKRQAAGK